MGTHQVLIVLVVDTRVIGCVADSLQECRFASIGPSDYKYTKVSVFRSKIIGIAVAHHGRCVEGKGRLRGNNITAAHALMQPRAWPHAADLVFRLT